jgi:hypothetical protein
MLDNLEQPSGQGADLAPHPAYTRPQKIAVAVLAVFGVFVVTAWFIQLKKSIRDPLAYSETSQQNSQNCPNGDCSGANTEALKNKDTDADGLTDYDELYTYKTSPYLEDTDSDGFSDKAELDSKNNPNCPVGRDCNATPLENDAAIIQPDGSATGTPSAEELDAEGAIMQQMITQTQASGAATGQNPAQNVATTAQDSQYQKLLNGTLDANSLRQMLLDTGMDKAKLDKISDEQLLQSYSDMTKSNKANN